MLRVNKFDRFADTFPTLSLEIGTSFPFSLQDFVNHYTLDITSILHNVPQYIRTPVLVRLENMAAMADNIML